MQDLVKTFGACGRQLPKVRMCKVCSIAMSHLMGRCKLQHQVLVESIQTLASQLHSFRNLHGLFQLLCLTQLHVQSVSQLVFLIGSKVILTGTDELGGSHTYLKFMPICIWLAYACTLTIHTFLTSNRLPTSSSASGISAVPCLRTSELQWA